MKIIFAFALSLLGLQAFSQSDSTDLNLYTTAIDSSEFEGNEFFDINSLENYLLEFTISDTVSFNSVQIELSENGNILYRHVYTLEELQNNNLIDENWTVTIEFGFFPKNKNYLVNLLIGSYSGVLSPLISKNF